MSTRAFDAASPAPRIAAKTATITVYGRCKAKTMGFIKVVYRLPGIFVGRCCHTRMWVDGKAEITLLSNRAFGTACARQFSHLVGDVLNSCPKSSLNK